MTENMQGTEVAVSVPQLETCVKLMMSLRAASRGASPSDSKAGAGQKNSGIAKPGGNAQGGQGQAAAAAAATGDSRLPLTGASMTGIVLAVAAIALGGGFILVRRRMAG